MRVQNKSVERAHTSAETTERRIYECLAQIARMDRIALILSTPVPTPELVLQFLQSVIKAEKENRSGGESDEEVRVHLLTPAQDSLWSVN